MTGRVWFREGLKLFVVVTLLIVLPLGLGFWFDTTYNVLPWGVLSGMSVGILMATLFVVRRIGNLYRISAPDTGTLTEKEDVT